MSRSTTTPRSGSDSRHFALIPAGAPERGRSIPIYRFFDLLLETDLALPGVDETGGGPPDLSVTLRRGGIPPDMAFEPFHEWRDRDGELAFTGARRRDEFLLRFPGLADFIVRVAANSIRIYPAEECEQHTLAHLLLDQVLPRYLNQQGRLVLHASCIETSPGLAVAFIGNTGRGKSTLASSFWQSGFRLVADDCVLVEREGGHYVCRPGYSSLRLWPDTAAALFGASVAFEPVAQYTDKKQILMGQVQSASPAAPSRLAALFVLQAPAGESSPDQPRVQAAGGSGAAMDIVESTFALDIESAAAVSQNLGLAAQLIESGLPVFRLAYPHRIDVLARVRDLVVGAVSGLGEAQPGAAGGGR